METIARAEDGRSRIEESNAKKHKFDDVDDFNKEEEGVSSSSLSEENLKKKGKFDNVDDFNKQGVELDSSGADPKKEGEEKEDDDVSEKYRKFSEEEVEKIEVEPHEYAVEVEESEGGEENKDVDVKEKENLEEDDDDSEFEEEEDNELEKLRKFSDEEIENMEVEPHEYKVELTEEEKKYYESPEYKNRSHGIKKNVEEGSWEYHYMTKREREIYVEEVSKSKGFHVSLFPGATCFGMLCRINFLLREDAIFIAKLSKLSLIYYNKKYGADYVFKCIEKANHQVTGVKTYYITFKAISAAHSYRAKTFQAKVHQGVIDTEVMRCRIKPGTELNSSDVDLEKGGEGREDVDEKAKEKENLEEDDDDSELEEEEDDNELEKLRKFRDEEIEKMEVEPHEYEEVELTEEEKKYYESPEYNQCIEGLDGIKENVEEGSWEYHYVTKKEHEIYVEAVNKSKGFDVPLLPGAIFDSGRVLRINLTWKKKAIFVAKLSKLALNYYNKKHGTDYVFKCIEKANCALTAVMTYYITFKAISDAHSDLANTFQAMVHQGVVDTEIMKCRIRP